MSIPVVREPEATTALFGEAESCCFCHQPTTHWTALPDRTPAEQVACCKDCADIFPTSLVPTKREWFAYHASQRLGVE